MRKKIALCFVMSLGAFSFAYASEDIDSERQTLEDIERKNTLSVLYSEEAKHAVNEAGYSLGKHTVERGQTWESIARQYNIEPDLLKALNSGH